MRMGSCERELAFSVSDVGRDVSGKEDVLPRGRSLHRDSPGRRGIRQLSSVLPAHLETAARNSADSSIVDGRAEKGRDDGGADSESAEGSGTGIGAVQERVSRG